MPQYTDVQPRFSPCTINRMKSALAVPPLRYKLQPMSSSQKRFEGRMVIEPQIDLSRYKCEAVLDWIWLEFETKRRTGSSSLRKHLKDLFGEAHVVLGSDAEHNDAADWNEIGTRFRMKIQDPQPWPIYELWSVIDAFRGLAGPIRILGMEIALDWRPNDASDAARWQMVATLQRHHLPMIRGLDAPNCDLRQTYERTEAEAREKGKAATEFVIHDRRLNASQEGSERAFSDLDLGNKATRTPRLSAAPMVIWRRRSARPRCGSASTRSIWATPARRCGIREPERASLAARRIGLAGLCRNRRRQLLAARQLLPG